MTKEQESALNHLKRMVGYLIYPDDVQAIMVGIQAIEDLDKMNGIALDLASENDDLIEKLDSIRAEISEMIEQETIFDTDNSRAQIIALEWVIETIDKYRKGGEI